MLWLLPCCLSVAGAVHGALLQAGSQFPGAPRLPTLAEKPSGFWVKAIQFYVVSTKEPPSAEVLRPPCLHQECEMRLGWALLRFLVSWQVLLLARADPHQGILHRCWQRPLVLSGSTSGCCSDEGGSKAHDIPSNSITAVLKDLPHGWMTARLKAASKYVINADGYPCNSKLGPVLPLHDLCWCWRGAWGWTLPCVLEPSWYFSARRSREVWLSPWTPQLPSAQPETSPLAASLLFDGRSGPAPQARWGEPFHWLQALGSCKDCVLFPNGTVHPLNGVMLLLWPLRCTGAAGAVWVPVLPAAPRGVISN